MELSELLLSILVSVLTSAVIYYHIKVFSFWSSRGIKGPRPWPLLGTMIYYLFRHKTDIHLEWRQKYGHTYGLYEGYSPVLHTTDNQLIKHVWIKDFSSFTDRNHKSVHSDHQRKWLIMSRGAHWANQRVLISPMFSSAKIKSIFTVMSSSVERFLLEIQAKITLLRMSEKAKHKSTYPTPTEEGAVLSKDDMMCLTLDVIAQSFFSIKMNTYGDTTSDFFRRAFAFAQFDTLYFMFWLMIPNSIAKYFQIDLFRFYKFEYFYNLSQAKILERRNEDATKTQRSLSRGMTSSNLFWMPKYQINMRKFTVQKMIWMLITTTGWAQRNWSAQTNNNPEMLSFEASMIAKSGHKWCSSS